MGPKKSVGVIIICSELPKKQGNPFSTMGMNVKIASGLDSPCAVRKWMVTPTVVANLHPHNINHDIIFGLKFDLNAYINN